MVEHTFMGKTGEEVSRLGFGCMRLPKNAEGRIDRGMTAEMFARAIGAGITYFDTAYFYHEGESERVAGEILSRFDKSRWTLTTKLPLILLQSADDAAKLFEEQRRRLGLDCFDYYLLHNVNKANWEKVKQYGVLDFLYDLKARGLVRHVGFSFHDEYALFDEVIHAAPWDLCQIQYNYLDENTQAGTRGYELAESLGIPMVVMEPIRGGALAKLTPDLEQELRALQPDWSPSSWALRWVAEHKNVKVILSGMSAPAQLEDNIATFTDRRPLTSGELAAIAHTAQVMLSRRANACTGCRYCMPCEQGVKIPFTFQTWNNYYRFHSYSAVRAEWERFLKPENKPTNCIGCGICETKCPQGISIRDDLARAQSELDNPVWD